jgi:hypothetical protein
MAQDLLAAVAARKLDATVVLYSSSADGGAVLAAGVQMAKRRCLATVVPCRDLWF